MKFEIASIDSIIIYFGDKIEPKISKEIRAAYYVLKEANLSFITDIIPSYTSVMVSFDFLIFSHEEMIKKLKYLLENKLDDFEDISSRIVTIPVYYSDEVGFDLKALAKEKNLTTEEVKNLHVNKEYFVYAIGFAPGFAYMGEVDKILATPRHANPRAKVQKGSVGIADNQTAIYPKESPGGWQIIGRTPLEMFDISYDGLSFLKVGDRVKFESISKEKFLTLGGEL